MAKIIETLKNISEYPNSFKRQGAFPLDSKSVFQSYGDAEKYAQDKSAAATSYVGQIISVIEDGTVNVYKIQNENGTLELVGTKTDWLAAEGTPAEILHKPNMAPGTKLNGEIDNSSIILAGGTISGGATSAATMRNSAVIGPGCIAGGRLFLIESFARAIVEDGQIAKWTSSIKEVKKWPEEADSARGYTFQFSDDSTTTYGTSSVKENNINTKPFNAFIVRQTGEQNDPKTIQIKYKLMGWGANNATTGEERDPIYTAQFQAFTFATLEALIGKTISFQKTGYSPYQGTVQTVKEKDGKWIVVLNQYFTLSDADGLLLYRLQDAVNDIKPNSNLHTAGVSFWSPGEHWRGSTEMNIFEENPLNATSLAIGVNSIARTPGAIALGSNCIANGRSSLAMGNHTQALGQLAFSFGQSSKALAEYAIAIGQTSSATSTGAIAIGRFTESTGSHAIALGGGDSTNKTIASGSSAFAAGSACMATGTGAIAMGKGSEATSEGAVALGVGNMANGKYSFAGGAYNKASNVGTFAFGTATQAMGYYSFALGEGTYTNGSCSLALGSYTRTENTGELAIGAYNQSDKYTLFTIGVGEGEETRSNIFQVNNDGSVHIKYHGNLVSLQQKLEELEQALDGQGSALSDFNTRITALEEKLNS